MRHSWLALAVGAACQSATPGAAAPVAAGCQAPPPDVSMCLAEELVAPGDSRQGTIDVNSLLADMVALDALARRDTVPWRTIEASSYDRSSLTPAASSDSPVGWYANHDWGNYIRTETKPDGRTEFVLLDVDGPGAIVRMWTANGTGTLRLYFDGDPDPTVVAPFADLLSGNVPPYVDPFAVVNSTGRNLDFPFPFRSHVKVTVEGAGPDYYYQVFHRQYAPGTNVETFRPEQITPAAMREVAAVLTGATAIPDAAHEASCPSKASPSLSLTVDPGGSEITEIDVTPGSADTATLRATVLSLTFDGQETARVPLGDFFGAGPGFLPHRTLPLEVTSDGTFVCRFVMPFRCSAEVRLESTTGAAAALSVRQRAAPFTTLSMYFHAHWIARGPIPTRPYRDLPIAAARGSGRYVGTTLAIDSRSSDWWGEGDEKIWVDDDGFPSWFGTGTEDFFGYANATNSSFDHAFRLLRRTGDARGQVTNARFLLLDAIPFATSLKFDLELWHWNPATTVFYDTVAYFYAAPGGEDLLPPPAAADFRLP